MENQLAENIRIYRKGMGLTQEQLAERLGITLGAVSKWERGSSEPDLAYIMELAELFHISVDALIGFSLRGSDADTEADRIEGLSESESVWLIAEEYENALKKFPNHFRIDQPADRRALQERCRTEESPGAVPAHHSPASSEPGLSGDQRGASQG